LDIVFYFWTKSAVLYCLSKIQNNYVTSCIVLEHFSKNGAKFICLYHRFEHKKHVLHLNYILWLS